MRVPLIGITTELNDSGECRLPGEYVAAVRRAGGIPVLLPPGEPQLPALLDALDGLILSGGGDVDPAHYGSPGHDMIYMIDPARDRMELALARNAAAGDMPTLGVCRGAQVINVALGGTLIEHLPDEVGEAVEHRLSPPGYVQHPIVVDPGSHLGEVLGASSVVAASWHHQAIRSLAPGLVVTAHAPDGTIEAVELPAHPWFVAVQWHPEITADADAVQQRLFGALIEEARRRGERRGRMSES